MPIDLRLHTQASDSTLTTEELLTEASNLGLTAVSITDHDTIDALQEGTEIADRLGLTFIPGVEISASYSPEISLHILAFGIDPENPKLRKVLQQNQKAWAKSEKDSIAALKRINIEIDRQKYDYWKAHSHTPEGGWPLLNTLREMGVVKDVNEYFGKYFGWGKPAYIDIIFASPEEVISTIKAAGGVPVLAHPGLYLEGLIKLITRPEFLNQLIEWGIEGLEAITNYHTAEEKDFLLSCCQSYELLVTGGSDYHGGFAGRRLGVPRVDDAYLEPLLKAIEKAQGYLG